MEPLVSILIITFNSSKTIIETLESAKQQSYKPIEIVVSDDCSNDDTVQKCKEWIEKNHSRFVNCKIVVAGENKGVSANCNQAIINATGEWAKLIAGDDIMMPDCIKDNIQYVKQNQDTFFVFTEMNMFVVEDGRNKIVGHRPLDSFKSFFHKTSEEQHTELFKCNCVPAPTLFCHLETLRNNLYKEEYRYCEDYPQWFLLTKKGFKLHMNPVTTVLYRVTDSLSQSKKYFINQFYLITFKQFFYDEMADYLLRNNPKEFKSYCKSFMLADFALYVLNNKVNFINRMLFKICRVFLCGKDRSRF